MRVLVVEDDDAVAIPLLDGLRRNGFDPTHAASATAALPAAHDADVVLLDLGLPDGDGLTVLRDLRASSEVPVIIVTARGHEADRVMGLELGADDYVVKPFSVPASGPSVGVDESIRPWPRVASRSTAPSAAQVSTVRHWT